MDEFGDGGSNAVRSCRGGRVSGRSMLARDESCRHWPRKRGVAIDSVEVAVMIRRKLLHHAEQGSHRPSLHQTDDSHSSVSSSCNNLNRDATSVNLAMSICI